jgi:hypothetical protein
MKAVLPLRLALMANAVFSFSTALLMFFNPVLVGEWLGIQAPQILQFVGIGLAIFASELIYQARSQRVATWRALLASAADFSWVVGSIFAVRFRSEAANFPFPAKTMRGGWEVISSDAGLLSKSVLQCIDFLSSLSEFIVQIRYSIYLRYRIRFSTQALTEFSPCSKASKP